MPPSGTAPAAATSQADGAHILLVGQDRAGHWIVRETLGLLGGIFIDRAAAIRFARSFPRARIEMATAPLPSPLAS